MPIITETPINRASQRIDERRKWEKWSGWYGNLGREIETLPWGLSKYPMAEFENYFSGSDSEAPAIRLVRANQSPFSGHVPSCHNLYALLLHIYAYPTKSRASNVIDMSLAAENIFCLSFAAIGNFFRPRNCSIGAGRLVASSGIKSSSSYVRHWNRKSCRLWPTFAAFLLNATQRYRRDGRFPVDEHSWSILSAVVL